MNRRTLLLAALCSVLTLFAASDYLNIYNADGLWKRIKVDNIKNMTFEFCNGASDDDPYDFQIMTVSYKDDTDHDQFQMSKITSMVYDHALSESPLSMTVTPHHRCATFHITSSDPDAYYRHGMFRADLVADLDQDELEQLIFSYETDKLNYMAEYSGYPLSHYTNDDVFWQGDQTLDCAPADIYEEMAMPGSDYIAYAYTATLTEDGGVEFTHAPIMVPFTAKSLELEDAEFTFDATMNSISITGNVTCQPEDKPFYVMAFDKTDVDSDGLQSLVQQQITNLETAVYRGSGNWADYIFFGNGSKTAKPVYAGQEVVIAAVGCEYGTITTEIASQTYTIPLPEVIDDCTFSVTSEEQSKSQITLNITPSNPDTRYVVLLDKTEDIGDADYYTARKMYYYTYTNQVLWPSANNDKRIFSGASSIDSKDDTLNGQYLSLDTPYTFLIYGVSEDGARTTAITKYEYTPTASSDTNKLTFDIQFGEFDASDDYYHSLPITITPSDLNAKYVAEVYKCSDMWLDWDDATFMSEWSSINGNGAYLDLHDGVYSQTLEFDNWGYGWETMMIFVYGYDTPSDLYLYTLNTETGEITQLRGTNLNQKDEELTFDIQFTEFDGSDSWQHNQYVTITPSDPNAKYVADTYKASDTWLAKSDSEFIDSWIRLNGNYLDLYTDELSTFFGFSNWGSWDTYMIFIFGYDGAATSPLYLYTINTETGEITQLRGPGM
jgi:hypothetical protein